MPAHLSTAIEVATATDSGMVRSHNEDSIATDADIGLAVLADGMGGYNAGEVASGIAVAMLMTEMKQVLENSNPYDIDSSGRLSRRNWCGKTRPRPTARFTRPRRASRSTRGWAPHPRDRLVLR